MKIRRRRTKYYTSSCETSVVTGIMLLDFDGAREGAKVAAEVDRIALTKMTMPHPVDVLYVLGPGDVDPAVVD